MTFWQRAFPHIIVLAAFMVLSLAYMSPLFEGKRLIQNDIIQARGAAQSLTTHHEKTGKRAFWADNIFSGMPAFMVSADYPSSLPTRIARGIVYSLPEPANALFLYMLGFYAMALLFGFSPWEAGMGGLFYALGSYNVINIEAGHASKVFTLAFSPVLIGAVYYAYNRSVWLGGALAGLSASFMLYGNHPQITYYVFLTLLLFVVYQIAQCATKKASWKQFVLASLVLLVAAGLAVGSHASRLWTTYEYTSQTIRGKSELKGNKQATSGAIDRDYAFQWSYGVGESFTFLIPNFYGSGSGAGVELGENSQTAKTLTSLGVDAQYAQSMPYYWGAQPFTSGPAYLGALVCMLAFIGVLASRNALRWWLLAASLLLVSIAWGKNFFLNDIFFQYLPLFNKFRAHTMTLSLLQVFVSGLALLGAQALLHKETPVAQRLRALYIGAGTIMGICLFFAVLGGVAQDFTTNATTEISEGGKKKTVNNDAMFVEQLAANFKGDAMAAKKVMRAIREDRAAMQASDAWRSFAFVLIGAGVIWAFLANFMGMEVALGALALIAMTDLWALDRRYLNNDNFKSKEEFEGVYALSEQESKVLEDTTRYRVANFTRSTFNDAVTSYNFASVGGYHGAKLRRYQDLIDESLSQKNMEVYNMLNTKYILFPDQKNETNISKNPGACGNAWFVSDYEIVLDADAEIKALGKLKPAEKAVIDKRFEGLVRHIKPVPQPKASEPVGKDSTDAKGDSTAKKPAPVEKAAKSGSIKLVSASPDELAYESNNTEAQLAIFSEIYYVQEGKIFWQAYIDDKPVPHFRANYVLRGLAVPAGKHKIKFKFEVPIYEKGETLSLVFSLVLLAFVGGAGFLFYREQKGGGEVVSE